MKTISLSLRLTAVLTAGILTASCQTMVNTLPVDTTRERHSEFMPQTRLEESPYFNRLMETYGDHLSHERVKIEYLLSMTDASAFEFDRNGVRYGGAQTAHHLRRKYRKRFREVKTAAGFIEHIATHSSQSGRHYLAFPGNGYAYHCGDLLTAELERVEQAVEKEAIKRGL